MNNLKTTPKQHVWRAQFCSIIEDNLEFVVAPTLIRAYDALKSKYGAKFLEKFLLEIKFHSVL